MSKKEYAETIDVARAALWIKTTKAGVPYMSGFLEFNDETKLQVRIFKAESKKSETSPDYFGMASVEEDCEDDELVLEVYENKFQPNTKKSFNKKAAARKQAVKKQRVVEEDVNTDEVPF